MDVASTVGVDWALIRGLLYAAGLALLLYMTAWYILSLYKRRLDVVDTAWGGSFVLVAWLAVAFRPSLATLLVAVLVSIWGGRLMKHTWRRHKRHDQDDPRYTKLSQGWKTAFWLQVFAKIFVLQGVLASFIAAPIFMNVQAVQLTGVALLGALLWAVGFYFESTADRQLRDFLANPKNKGHVMNEGLWRYSRHPNYFGESVQWFGIAIIALTTPWGWIGLAGPALLTFLLVFVSGIPTVEKGKHKDPEYRQYQKTTSSFIPLPPKKNP